MHTYMIKSMKGIKKIQVNDFQGMGAGVKAHTRLPSRRWSYFFCVFAGGEWVCTWRSRVPQALSALFSEPRSLTKTRSSAIRLGWLAAKPQNSFSLSISPELGEQGCAIRTQALCLHSKHFTNRAILPAPRSYFLSRVMDISIYFIVI